MENHPAETAVASSNGTILEAAFVDQAYFKPDGVELENVDDASSNIDRALPTPAKTAKTKGKWGCCCQKGAADDVITMPNERRKLVQELRQSGKYVKVPDGLLIYRLDTASHEIVLLSENKTGSALEYLVIKKASPSNDASRRGIALTGEDGKDYMILASEQRTATAWLQAMENMTNKKNKVLSQGEQGDYLTLASYSNKLIHAGAIPGQKAKKSAGGIYTTMTVQKEAEEEQTEAVLEALAKRRAVVKDSWDFYRMVCSLLRDQRKLAEVFRKLQLDNVYPYLNSMTGLNDAGDGGTDATKELSQTQEDHFRDLTQTQLATVMNQRAEKSLPALLEICKSLAVNFGMEEVGVGPVKEVPAALRKAERKYEGDVMKVTDYCRALLVVKDFPALLALLELARDSFGPLVRRVKLSSLKTDISALPGGYRDCKINLEVLGHICEIQVHLWPMWKVCGVDGYRHYRHCLEYNTGSFQDPYDALDGLDSKTLSELIVIAEEAVAETPLDELKWFEEKFILDYFAEVGLFVKHGLHVWGETTLRTLIQLRTENQDMGPNDHETLILTRYLEQELKLQGKKGEAKKIAKRVQEIEDQKNSEKAEAEKSMWDTLVSGDALDMIIDPNKKEREDEEQMKKEVKASKRHWRKIRAARFKFLESSREVASQRKGHV